MKAGDLVKIKPAGRTFQWKNPEMVGKTAMIVKTTMKRRFKQYTILISFRLYGPLWEVDLEKICELED